MTDESLLLRYSDSTGYILKSDVTVSFLNVNIYHSLEVTYPETINSIFCLFSFENS